MLIASDPNRNGYIFIINTMCVGLLRYLIGDGPVPKETYFWEPSDGAGCRTWTEFQLDSLQRERNVDITLYGHACPVYRKVTSSIEDVNKYVVVMGFCKYYGKRNYNEYKYFETFWSAYKYADAYNRRHGLGHWAVVTIPVQCEPLED